MLIIISCEPAFQAGNSSLKEDWYLCKFALMSNIEVTGLSNLKMNMQAKNPSTATHGSVDVLNPVSSCL